MENINTPESLSYCFRVLDISGKGVLDDFIIKYFFQAAADKMGTFGQDGVSIEDVAQFDTQPHPPQNEIFDMANCQTHEIRLKDLVNCGVGGTIINILSDARGFLAYENRETLDPT
ncbi:hypothetical protein BDK51DRAFT_27683 [Blyttiomyces helicus]|uniref:EF-hand domain-containing protein n=1 Tax=Blyttiomyces helicus TaxID=388810 RepID=A0A4P9VZG7_9FUNG|nr:hypothetical protein BDK51DRAFT_27683 [Blyttiomyces helicus]|eukprot:RKO85211.1 hypothetical protein BDK51DRAFT_27683 [Blyttiomyces helicus]